MAPQVSYWNDLELIFLLGEKISQRQPNESGWFLWLWWFVLVANQVFHVSKTEEAGTLRNEAQPGRGSVRDGMVFMELVSLVPAELCGFVPNHIYAGLTPGFSSVLAWWNMDTTTHFIASICSSFTVQPGAWLSAEHSGHALAAQRLRPGTTVGAQASHSTRGLVIHHHSLLAGMRESSCPQAHP